MARRKKRQSDSQPMSFFSFQDIMTCVTGIMLLLALTLVLELLTRKATQALPTPQVTQNEIRDTQAQLEKLKQLVEQNREALKMASSQVRISQQVLNALSEQIKNMDKSLRQLEARTSMLSADKKETLNELEQLKNKNRELVKLLAQLKAKDNKRRLVRVTLRNRPGENKIPYWVELGKSRVTVNDISFVSRNVGAVDNIKTFAGPDAIKDFLSWANTSSQISTMTNQFVLLIRPDAIADYPAVDAQLKKMGFVTGCDVWPAGRSLLAEGEK